MRGRTDIFSLVTSVSTMDEGTIKKQSLNVVFTGVFVWGGVAIL